MEALVIRDTHKRVAKLRRRGFMDASGDLLGLTEILR
jgi:hypothetical protein